MTQLDRIEAMLKELVHELRLRRVEAECQSFNESMSGALGIDAETGDRMVKSHEKRCADIMKGKA